MMDFITRMSLVYLFSCSRVSRILAGDEADALMGTTTLDLVWEVTKRLVRAGRLGRMGTFRFLDVVLVMAGDDVLRLRLRLLVLVLLLFLFLGEVGVFVFCLMA